MWFFPAQAAFFSVTGTNVWTINKNRAENKTNSPCPQTQHLQVTSLLLLRFPLARLPRSLPHSSHHKILPSLRNSRRIAKLLHLLLQTQIFSLVSCIGLDLPHQPDAHNRRRNRDRKLPLDPELLADGRTRLILKVREACNKDRREIGAQQK